MYRIYALTFFSLFISISGSKPIIAETLLISGSSTLAPLVSELATQYEKTHPNLRIEVQTGGSARGVSDCRNGSNQIGMISRHIKESEKDLKVFPIARDGLVFVVHSKNSISNLNKAHILDIYTGKIKNWRELGGTDENITVINKAEGRATLDLFLQYFSLKSSQIKADIIIGDEEHGIKTIASIKGGIAYLSLSSAELAQKRGQLKILDFEQKTPSMQAVRNGKYAFARVLNLITCPTKNRNSNQKQESEKLIKFVQSVKGQKVIEELKYIPL